MWMAGTQFCIHHTQLRGLKRGRHALNRGHTTLIRGRRADPALAAAPPAARSSGGVF